MLEKEDQEGGGRALAKECISRLRKTIVLTITEESHR
jgi:hypothetical protein